MQGKVSLPPHPRGTWTFLGVWQTSPCPALTTSVHWLIQQIFTESYLVLGTTHRCKDTTDNKTKTLIVWNWHLRGVEGRQQGEVKYTVCLMVRSAIQDKEHQIGEGAVCEDWARKAFLMRRYWNRYVNKVSKQDIWLFGESLLARRKRKCKDILGRLVSWTALQPLFLFQREARGRNHLFNILFKS